MIYIPDQFCVNDHKLLWRVMQENSFATLVAGSGEQPIVAHLPVVVDEAAGLLHAHVAHANPLWRALSPDREVLCIFHGPHHYVSPNWYNVHPSVPTWNYAVVHVSGHPVIVTDRARVESMLRSLVEAHESRLETPWKMDLPADYLENMVDGVVAFELRINRIEGKFKLSQNRSNGDRSKVIAALKRDGSDSAVGVAALMELVRRR